MSISNHEPDIRDEDREMFCPSGYPRENGQALGPCGYIGCCDKAAERRRGMTSYKSYGEHERSSGT